MVGGELLPVLPDDWLPLPEEPDDGPVEVELLLEGLDPLVWVGAGDKLLTLLLGEGVTTGSGFGTLADVLTGTLVCGFGETGAGVLGAGGGVETIAGAGLDTDLGLGTVLGIPAALIDTGDLAKSA